jgi:hypothetical protein
MGIVELLIVVLVIAWLIGMFPMHSFVVSSGFGSIFHVLLLIAIIIIVVKLIKRL